MTAGVGFGVFQAVNRRAVSGMPVYLATFIQLLVSVFILGIITLITVDKSIIRSVSPAAALNFALAGFFHFFMGWTFLNASQKRIGATRTSPLFATTPLFGAGIAALTLNEFPDPISWVGIGIIVFGAYLVSKRARLAGSEDKELSKDVIWRGSLLALGAAVSWSISPIFIRAGLAEVPSPLLGSTIGMAATTLVYTVPLFAPRNKGLLKTVTNEALALKIFAGVLVGLSTFARWVALDLTEIAAVLAITLIATPIVLILSPLVSNVPSEKLSLPLVSGAVLIIGGALILVIF